MGRRAIPTNSSKKYVGIFYKNAQDTADAKHQLTKAQLKKLDLNGLNVKAFHNGDWVAGAVTKHWYDDARNEALVEFVLDRDDPIGARTESVLNEMKCMCLSLSHYVENGEVYPNELSILFDPGREGTYVVNAHMSNQEDPEVTSTEMCLIGFTFLIDLVFCSSSKRARNSSDFLQARISFLINLHQRFSKFNSVCV